jgi:hypothetical protein
VFVLAGCSPVQAEPPQRLTDDAIAELRVEYSVVDTNMLDVSGSGAGLDLFSDEGTAQYSSAVFAAKITALPGEFGCRR